MDVKDILDKLAERRPVFHSEADFQFEFAHELQNQYSDAHVRLEYPYVHLGVQEQTPRGRQQSLDIFAKLDGKSFLLELKYLTRQTEISFGDERFQLRTHAQNLRSYDVFKDIERLEHACAIETRVGYVVVLSNNKSYTQKPGNQSDHAEFSIHQSREIDGSKNIITTLNWQNPARNDRRGPISLSGSYRFDWGGFGNGKYSFRHLIIPVCGRRQ